MSRTKNAAPTFTKVAPLYGRCLKVTIGTVDVELKVMGERQAGADSRELLFAAFAALGIPVEEASK